MSPPHISPILLLEGMYRDQLQISKEQKDGEKILDLVDFGDLESHRVALNYSKQRDDLVDRIYQLASRFNQRQRTKHVAVELLDHLYLNKRGEVLLRNRMTARGQNIVLTTCFLVASKFDEIDDRLVFIKDVQNYYRSIDLGGRQGHGPPRQSVIPTYTDIVECERQIMEFFDWNITFTLTSPLMFLECYLSQGTLVSRAAADKMVQADVMRACNDITRFAFKFLDEMVARRVPVRHFPGWTPSFMAAFALYKAREEIIEKRRNAWMGEVWPPELQLLTLLSEKHMKSLFLSYKECLQLQRDILRVETNANPLQPSEQQYDNTIVISDISRDSSESFAGKFEKHSAHIQNAFEAAKNSSFKCLKRKSTVTKIELVPKESLKKPSNANFAGKRMTLDLSQPMFEYHQPNQPQPSIQQQRQPQQVQSANNSVVQFERVVRLPRQGNQVVNICNLNNRKTQLAASSQDKRLNQNKRPHCISLPRIEPVQRHQFKDFDRQMGQTKEKKEANQRSLIELSQTKNQHWSQLKYFNSTAKPTNTMTIQKKFGSERSEGGAGQSRPMNDAGKCTNNPRKQCIVFADRRQSTSTFNIETISKPHIPSANSVGEKGQQYFDRKEEGIRRQQQQVQRRPAVRQLDDSHAACLREQQLSARVKMNPRMAKGPGPQQAMPVSDEKVHISRIQTTLAFKTGSFAGKSSQVNELSEAGLGRKVNTDTQPTTHKQLPSHFKQSDGASHQDELSHGGEHNSSKHSSKISISSGRIDQPNMFRQYAKAVDLSQSSFEGASVHSDQTAAIAAVPVHQKPSILVTGIVRLDGLPEGSRQREVRESSGMVWQRNGKARPAYLTKENEMVKGKNRAEVDMTVDNVHNLSMAVNQSLMNNTQPPSTTSKGNDSLLVQSGSPEHLQTKTAAIWRRAGPAAPKANLPEPFQPGRKGPQYNLHSKGAARQWQAGLSISDDMALAKQCRLAKQTHQTCKNLGYADAHEQMRAGNAEVKPVERRIQLSRTRTIQQIGGGRDIQMERAPTKEGGSGEAATDWVVQGTKQYQQKSLAGYPRQSQSHTEMHQKPCQQYPEVRHSSFQSYSTEKESGHCLQTKIKSRPSDPMYVISSGTTSMDKSTGSQPSCKQPSIKITTEAKSTDAANKFGLRNLSFIYQHKQADDAGLPQGAKRLTLTTSNQQKQEIGAPVSSTCQLKGTKFREQAESLFTAQGDMS